MDTLPPCPKCAYEYTYKDRELFVCPECSNEWKVSEVSQGSEEPIELVVKDANGNQLRDGDTVTVVKDLKIKGTSSVVKVGTKIKISRLTDGDHNIDCRVEGFGAMGLKSEFVKKVS